MSANARDGGELVIANEFAAVVVRKVSTRNGERLEIRSANHGQRILLDAIALESLTWSTALEVGKNLETPHGPDPAHQRRPPEPRVDADNNGEKQ
ncbi:dihydrodiol dehydrogenase [Nocardia sp. R6R-6]|uniref:dihydrodiol dehydrogenase n=1 Tax=Nocardia sp. R6R-6 TaxID=3459303 RepID=UPI00403D8F98